LVKSGELGSELSDFGVVFRLFFLLILF